MQITQVTNPASVWQTSPRTITGLNGSIANQASGIGLSLANGAAVRIQPNAGTLELQTVVCVSNANVSWNVGLTNGTVNNFGFTGALNTNLIEAIVATNTIYTVINNSGTVAGIYAITRFAFVQ